MWPYGPWGFPWVWIFPLIFLGVMLLIVYLIFGRGGFQPPCAGRNAHDGGPGDQKPDSPLEILKRRYARGEITKEEFERVKGDILG